jgi:hypothetical protein
LPYKGRLKQGEPRKRKKPGYRVTNARAYNQSLRKRGMISLYVPSGDLKAPFINANVLIASIISRWNAFAGRFASKMHSRVPSTGTHAHPNKAARFRAYLGSGPVL